MATDTQGAHRDLAGDSDVDESTEPRSEPHRRTDRRHELRVYLSDKDQRMLDRMRKDLDCNASDLTRAALRDYWLKIHGRVFR